METGVKTTTDGGGDDGNGSHDLNRWILVLTKTEWKTATDDDTVHAVDPTSSDDESIEPSPPLSTVFRTRGVDQIGL